MVPTRLNKKRLTKRETQALIDSGALLDEELSQLFSFQGLDEKKVYHLPDNNILFVYESYPAGKSDMYSKEVFSQWIQAVKASKRYSKLGISNSFAWFLHFSKYKTDLPNNVDTAIGELITVLEISPKHLDYTLKSLDEISEKVKAFGIEENEHKFVDGLVAYCGEIIRRTIKGEWKHLEQDNMPVIFKEVSWFFRHNWYHPVNQVWDAFYDPANFPLRKVIRNEIARFNMVKNRDGEKDTWPKFEP